MDFTHILNKEPIEKANHPTSTKSLAAHLSSHTSFPRELKQVPPAFRSLIEDFRGHTRYDDLLNYLGLEKARELEDLEKILGQERMIRKLTEQVHYYEEMISKVSKSEPLRRYSPYSRPPTPLSPPSRLGLKLPLKNNTQSNNHYYWRTALNPSNPSIRQKELDHNALLAKQKLLQVNYVPLSFLSPSQRKIVESFPSFEARPSLVQNLRKFLPDENDSMPTNVEWNQILLLAKRTILAYFSLDNNMKEGEVFDEQKHLKVAITFLETLVPRLQFCEGSWKARAMLQFVYTDLQAFNAGGRNPEI